MAATNVVFALLEGGYPHAGSAVSETLDPTAEATTEIEAPDYGGRPILCRIATDTAINVNIGPAPDAEGDGVVLFTIPANMVAEFLVNKGDKVSVVALA
jgi:hypothetical protein